MWLPPAKNLEAAIKNCVSTRMSDPEQVKQFTKDLAEVFQLIAKTQTVNILLTSYNVPDGTGDFSNLIDFYSMTKNVFNNIPGISVKVIALVSKNKLDGALRLLPDHFDRNNNLYIHDIDTKTFYGQKATQNEIVIISCNLGKHPSQLNMDEIEKLLSTSGSLQAFFQKANFVLNIATPFQCTNNIFLRYLNANCLIRSLLEYAPPSDIRGFPLNTNIYVEDSMGFREQDAGIKFNEKIVALSNQTPHEKATLLKKLDNMLLRNLLLSLEDREKESHPLTPEQYAQSTYLGVGYLQKTEKNQSTNYTNNFVLLLAATTDKKNIDAIINTDLLDLRGIIELLTQYGIKQVQTYNELNKLPVEQALQGNGNKILRIFKFSGLTNNDVILLYSAANVTAGSGDNSLSNVISSQAFPFFGVLRHKIETFDALINYIAQSKCDPNNILQKYLLFMKMRRIRTDIIEYDPAEFCNYAHKHQKEILEVWRLVCQLMYQHKNVQTYFEAFITQFVLVHCHRSNRFDSVLKNVVHTLAQHHLLNLANEYLIHSLIMINNRHAILALLQEGADIEELTQKYGLNCLRLAVHLKNEELTQLFLKKNANANLYIKDRPSVIQQALSARFNQDTIHLILSKTGNIKVEDSEELLEVLAPICANKEYLAIFLEAGQTYNKNLVLYYAVMTDDIQLARTAIAAGAQNETSSFQLVDWSRQRNEYDKFIATQNTTLHLAVIQGRREMIQLLVEHCPTLIYDDTNSANKTVTDLTKDPTILAILNTKMARHRVSALCQVPVNSIHTRISGKVCIECTDFDAAWKVWLWLQRHNIICDRPEKGSLDTVARIIYVNRALFERAVREEGFRAELPTPSAQVKAILAMDLPNVISKEIMVKPEIKPHGINGILILAANKIDADKLEKLLTECHLSFNYCEKDFSFEITHINNSYANIMKSFEFLRNRRELSSQLLLCLNLQSTLNIVNLILKDEKIAIHVMNEDNAWRLWEILKSRHIYLYRPKDNTLTMDLEIFQFLLKGEQFVKPIVNEEVSLLLKLDIGKVIAEKCQIKLKNLESLSSNGIVLYFANPQDAEKFCQYLDSECSIDSNYSARDSSVEITVIELAYFKKFIESNLQTGPNLASNSQAFAKR